MNENNSSNKTNNSEHRSNEEDGHLSTGLILTLTLLFIFLIIASIILVFVLIKNKSIKRKLNESEPPIVNEDEGDKRVVNKSSVDSKATQKTKEVEDKDLVNKITIYSSGKSVSTNAVINVKI